MDVAARPDSGVQVPRVSLRRGLRVAGQPEIGCKHLARFDEVCILIDAGLSGVPRLTNVGTSKVLSINESHRYCSIRVDLPGCSWVLSILPDALGD